jgi:hypothetical protein
MLMLQSLQSQLDDLLARICLALQLSPTQYNLAEQRYLAVGAWLEAGGSPLARLRPRIYPQGSLRIGTTVRPIGRDEYDLDFVCELQVDPRSVGHPLVLLNAVEERLKQHDTYRSMMERKNRCIRLRYANEFHLDILPACPDPSKGNDCVLVPDRTAMSWRPSNPIGYADWFESRAALAQAVLIEKAQPLPEQESVDTKAPLKLIVQLLKRWRDVAYTKSPDLAPISIVLTTLAGESYTGEQSVSAGLSQTLDAVHAQLSPKGQWLVVRNPANPAEVLSEAWSHNHDAFGAFVRGLADLRDAWREISGGMGIHECTRILERLFGETITRQVLKEQAAVVARARAEGRLGAGRSGGILGISSTEAVPIRRNTFYGR